MQKTFHCQKIILGMQLCLIYQNCMGLMVTLSNVLLKHKLFLEVSLY